MTTGISADDIKLYSQQFDNLNRLIGKRIDKIEFYLNDTDTDFTEVENKYGKSLLSGIDIKVDSIYYSIGNRFTNIHYGLTIAPGKTTEFEFIEDEKKPLPYPSKLIGQIITSIDIYWMKIPFEGAIGFYPQEILIKSNANTFLLSSIEINNGEANTEFTDELLIIEDEHIAKQLELGHFGLNNSRLFFNTVDELINNGHG
jgi:hypothetical protein